MVQSWPGGGSSFKPRSQRTDFSLPPKQEHWKVNSTSSTVPLTSPVPPQYGQPGSLSICFVLYPWGFAWSLSRGVSFVVTGPPGSPRCASIISCRKCPSVAPPQPRQVTRCRLEESRTPRLLP